MVRKHESGATQDVSMVGGGNGSVLYTAALLTCAGSPLIMCHPEVAASAAGAALGGLTHYSENTTSANHTPSQKKDSPLQIS